MSEIIALDFGTTNSVLAVADEAGNVKSASFEVGNNHFDTYRTILYLWQEQDIKVAGSVPQLRSCSGPFAIAEYQRESQDCRLIQSIKSYLAAKDFEGTDIFGTAFSLEDLISTFLNQIHYHAENQLGHLGRRVISGRPVAFAGSRPDNAFAEARLRASYEQAGFEVEAMVYEPLAASYYYGRTLDRPETVLVADFGGGTSDFSVIRFEPGKGIAGVKALAHTGLGIAGDSFDYRIIQNVVWPRLGFGSSYRAMGGKLPVPRQYYTAFARWHYLSMMRNQRTMADLQAIIRTAESADDIADLVTIIEDELGFFLYQSVSKVKAELSSSDHALLQFKHGGVEIDEKLSRADFESWISPDIADIEKSAKQCLDQAGLKAGDISKVFMTGGTSYVPAVRRLFEDGFGKDKVEIGQPFLSVAHGLAMIAADEQIV
ncbi:Hsp70 family protein [Thalassospira sp. MCCC 1A01428]|uniref:Hsp70 family protein n=1 Tax=Thalassospira sp. MCCC 1A01428 TaxID=1470575 RepID=UPI000A1D96F0|nr:Hsp70 family protein [Thalassospira sp. MCCC 1A01428]OSQ41688.1 molecular chaperone Hsp70 [Thalassospira sp. MCCC 1A01428]